MTLALVCALMSQTEVRTACRNEVVFLFFLCYRVLVLSLAFNLPDEPEHTHTLTAGEPHFSFPDIFSFIGSVCLYISITVICLVCYREGCLNVHCLSVILRFGIGTRYGIAFCPLCIIPENKPSTFKTKQITNTKQDRNVKKQKDI